MADRLCARRASFILEQELGQSRAVAAVSHHLGSPSRGELADDAPFTQAEPLKAWVAQGLRELS